MCGMINNIEEFHKMYPNVRYEEMKNGTSILYGGIDTMNSSMQVSFPMAENTENLWKDESNRIDKELEYRKLYPNLVLYINQKTLVISSLWVLRGGSGDEAIPLAGTATPKILKEANEQAGKALQPGWFYCTGHGRAEEMKPGGYFHFAGKYCAEYGIEHPDSLQGARNERYD